MISDDPTSTSDGRTDPLWLSVIQYIRRGWCPIPIPYGSKAPRWPEWQKLRPDTVDLAKLFPDVRMNVGISLGAASGGLVDLDLDCQEARASAKHLALPTHCVWGRASASDSHRLYIVADPPDQAAMPWGDPVRTGKGSRLLEIRSTKGQTVCPPSLVPGDRKSVV